MLRCRRYSSVTVLDSQYDRQPLASCCFSICPPIALMICRTQTYCAAILSRSTLKSMCFMQANKHMLMVFLQHTSRCCANHLHPIAFIRTMQEFAAV